jgi:predicted Rossmann fold nucleotide-binding protein DprA/Smf involved in DNA uptake
MVRIGVTGHMDITDDSARLIYEEIAQLIAEYDTVTGVSCIARGADSVFAQAILDAGGRLEVVVPSRNYRAKKVKPDHAELFDDLVERAALVEVMPFEDAGPEAYEAANEIVAGSVDRLVAVWDGQPGKRGGTGTVVELARAKGVPVDVVWPSGAQRG